MIAIRSPGCTQGLPMIIRGAVTAGISMKFCWRKEWVAGMNVLIMMAGTKKNHCILLCTVRIPGNRRVHFDLCQIGHVFFQG